MQDQDDQESSMEEEDEDLITSIDRERREAKQRGIKKALREKRKAQIDEVRSQRGKWESKRSELITYAKMMCDYFEYVNKEANQGQFEKIT
jgi:hypothetical protein